MAWALLVVLSLGGVASLRIETTVDSVLDRSGSEWSFYQDSQQTFGGDEVVVLMLRSEEPYGRGILERVQSLSRELGAIPGVRRVDSVATMPLVTSGRDGHLVVEPPLSDELLLSGAPGRVLRKIVEADKTTEGLLVSADGRAFGLNLLLEEGAYEQSGQILDRLSELAGEDGIWSGVPVFRNETNKRTESELISFVPVTAGLIFILFIVLFRSVVLAVLPLLTSGVSVAVVVGAMGALDMPMTISTLILPTVLLALGCAYSMHPICAATAPLAREREGDLKERLVGVALPVALSGLTTAIGFVALSTVRINALRQVGGLGGFGALVATGAVLTLLPALLSLIPLPFESPGQRWLRVGAPPGLVLAVDRHGFGITVGFVVVSCLALVGLGQVRVESDVIQWFPPSDPLRIAYSEIRDELSGISPVNVVVEGLDGQAIAEPDVLAALSLLSDHLEALPDVSRATSIATPVEQVHRELAEDAGAQLVDTAMIEQYLLVLSGADHVQDLLSFDRKKANVWVRSRSNASEDLLSIAREAENWWSANGPSWTSAQATGIMFEFARAQRAISWGQVSGLGLAFAVISLVLYLAFGSMSVALVALLPNVVPILVSFGLLGWANVPLDAGTVLVGNLALGIAVDDTIHLISSLEDGKGGDFVGRLSRCFSVVLPPLCFTTLVLAAGFAVLGLSSFLFIRNLGLLTALILVVCLVADLLLLPCLIKTTGLLGKGRALKTAP